MRARWATAFVFASLDEATVEATVEASRQRTAGDFLGARYGMRVGRSRTSLCSAHLPWKTSGTRNGSIWCSCAAKPWRASARSRASVVTQRTSTCVTVRTLA